MPREHGRARGDSTKPSHRPSRARVAGQPCLGKLLAVLPALVWERTYDRKGEPPCPSFRARACAFDIAWMLVVQDAEWSASRISSRLRLPPTLRCAIDSHRQSQSTHDDDLRLALRAGHRQCRNPPPSPGPASSWSASGTSSPLRAVRPVQASLYRDRGQIGQPARRERFNSRAAACPASGAPTRARELLFSQHGIWQSQA
ncbi:hypothetical protein L1887_47742 [Cichorium endivia]|nr:hypothetical protein L1887_47742 [Cichorium endivia]